MSLTVALLTYWGLFGQITISSNDMPTPGYVAKISTPDTLLLLDPAPTGANFVWDFSSLTAVAQRTDSFISPNAVPLLIRIQFPFSVNVVKVQETPDSLAGFTLGEGYEVFKTSNGAFEHLGLAGTISGIPLVLENDPSDSVYVFPLQYGTQSSSVSEAELEIPGLFFIRRKGSRVNEVDGWGQLSTPYGTFDVLRVNSLINESDSVVIDTISFSFTQPTRREYKWLAREEAVPVLQINTIVFDSTEVTANIGYVDSVRTFSTTSVQDLAKSLNVSVYPNPAVDQIQLRMEEFAEKEFEMEIRSLTGKLIRTHRLNTHEVMLPVHFLPSGTYLIRIKGGDKTYDGKLVIQR